MIYTRIYEHDQVENFRGLDGLTRRTSASTFAHFALCGTLPDGPISEGRSGSRSRPYSAHLPRIRKHDRRRPWKTPKTRGKNSPSDGVRRFRPDGSASLGWEGRPSGSDLDPRLKTRGWQKAREVILANSPLCLICEAVDQIRPATEVDHLVPRSVDPDRFTDPSNLWGLCRSCHQAKTILERRGVNLETPERWTIAVLLKTGRLTAKDLRGYGVLKSEQHGRRP